MSNYGPITSSGTVTSYLPLTSAWSAPAQCSSLFLKAGDNLFLNSPQYDQVVPGAPECNPPELSPWWYQSLDTASPTATLLGGYEFVCPAAYTTVFSWVTAETTTIGCCPSAYSYAGTWWRAGFPSQCESSIPTGTITFVQPGSGTVYTTTSEFISTPSVVWGVQVNGFKIQPPQTSAATTTTTTTTSAGVSQSTQTSSTSSATSSSTSSSSSKLSTGSIVGIVTGSVSAVATVLGLVFRVYKWKQKQRQSTQERGQDGMTGVSFGKEMMGRLCANCGTTTTTQFCTKCGARA
ncbi:hypothetical protein BGW36DRAFT_428171 [Talaromyces proteolyticus]|uniref:Uncharacterized protein n=1 Tax=Talaromyces proteolyticus TaxID=1131652 RepID=A0AAD4KP72_9EURO|nr:uncharacterized protein BGW36DRAFT_428171 [Talaromyces proteolyticus]KAH8696151.1 hypothetical protein BGW36DRAFT_428171 [Talaromyces proteolyticus]